jgi:hypothetical protein
MKTEISCPVNNILVNENKIRIIAFQVFLLAIAYLLFPGWIIPAILFADFFLRAFNLVKYSPAGILSGWIVSALHIKNKPTDQAPKIFAAQLGFVIVGILFILSLAGYLSLSFYVDGVLILFSFLESVLGFCAGCYVYTILKKDSDKE